MGVRSLPPVAAARRALLWRLHFWSALLASPFVLVACLTGLLYVFTPQIEAVWHGPLDTVAPQAQSRPLDDAVAAAQRAAPEGWRLHSVAPAATATASVRVAFMPPALQAPPPAGGHGSHGATPTDGAEPFLRPSFGIPARALVVYVNPYTTDVLGQLPEAERFAPWARRLHSSLLQGNGWRWMIELAASWMLVMLVTGVFLWWPSPGQPGRPSRAARGRQAWRQWHAFLGVALGLVSLVILATGLTWSQWAGQQVRWARDATGQTPPRIPAHFHSTVLPNQSMLDWTEALHAVRQHAPEVAVQLLPPQGPAGVWRANQLDTRHPSQRFDLLLDAYSGQPLFFSGWRDQTVFGQATAIGIPFHRGEFGGWNQAVLVLFGAGVLFALVSGWAMFWHRRRQGADVWPAVPAGAWRRVSPWAWLAGLLAWVAMPVLAVSACLPLLVEAVWAWQRRGAAMRTQTNALPG